MKISKFYLYILILTFFFTHQTYSRIWYVDNRAGGTNNGVSWINAWESFADISWGSISARDTIFISGGTDSTVYAENFNIGVSGSSDNPILITIGQSSPHNGKVVITGSGGLDIINRNYITISGRIGSSSTKNIKIRDASGDGVTANSTTGVIIEYLDVCWNGDDGVSFDEYVGGGNIVRNCVVHDNYDYNVIANRPADDENAAFVNDEHLIIENNEIFNLGNDGIHAAAYAGGLTIRNNHIHGQPNGDVNHYSGYVDGMQLRGFVYLTVESNVIHDLWSSDGVNGYIFIECDIAVQSNIVGHDIYVYNNVIFETDHLTNASQNSKGIEFKPDACTSLKNVEIANNTIVDTRVWGIQLHEFENINSDNMENIRIVNNIIYNNDQRTGGSGDRISFVLNELHSSVTTGSVGDDVDIIWDYNLVDAYGGTATCRYGVGNGTLMDYSAFNAASGCDDHGVAMDPTFMNWVENSVTNANDLSLSENDQAAIDAGTPSTIFIDDFEGTSRPQGNNWDIGAFEGVSTNSRPGNVQNLRIIRVDGQDN